MANGTPFFGDKVDVLHNAPGEDDDQIRRDDYSGMLGELGEAFQLGFTATVVMLEVRHSLASSIRCYCSESIQKN